MRKKKSKKSKAIYSNLSLKIEGGKCQKKKGRGGVMSVSP